MCNPVYLLLSGRHLRVIVFSTIAVVASVAFVPTPGAAQEMTQPPPITLDNDDDGAEEILERYAEAWRGEEEMKLRGEAVLAFRVTGEKGGEYHVLLPPEGAARLVEGAPDSFTFGFETDMETLRRLDRGEWNAFTAMGQARGTDPIPLVPKTPEGFKWTPENRGYFIPLLFHFWNREWPETIRFGEGTTRPVHGGNAAIFYYDRGLRSAWYQIRPGMHVNEDPADQTNDFHTLVIMSRGAIKSRLAGIERELREGEAVFIPAGMTHEFWAGPEQYGECIILMFGEGA